MSQSAENGVGRGGVCEPCWNEAFRQSRLLGGSQVDYYHRLLEVLSGHPHGVPDVSTPDLRDSSPS